MESVLWGVIVGGALVVGALLGTFLPERERLASAVTVFGGGMLLGALAFDIVPEAEEHASLWVVAAGLAAGTLLFLGLDWLITRDEGRAELRRALHARGSSSGGPEAAKAEAGRGKSIALGVLIDGVPETAALGITVAEGAVGLPLLAAIVVSNLAESYGASEAISEGYPRMYPTLIFGGIGLALLGALVLGATLLSGTSDTVIGAAEAVAGGAIFGTVLIAIVPHAFAEVSRWAAVSAVGGLIVAYLLS